MALWYDVGAGMNKISFASRTTDRTAFLCASGPSLGLINPSYLNGPNRTVFALNNAYPTIRPDVWLGMDDPTCYSRELFGEPFIKILRGGYQNRPIESGAITRNFNTYYADCAPPKDRGELFNLRKHDVKFVWHGNTLMIAMHIIVWMGFNRIYLVGCDLDNSKQAYHSSVKADVSDDYLRETQRLYDQIHDWIQWFAAEGQHHGIKTYSCSPNSRINEYLDYRSYLDVIDEREQMIARNQPLYNPVAVEEKVQQERAAMRKKLEEEQLAKEQQEAEKKVTVVKKDDRSKKTTKAKQKRKKAA